MGRWSGLVLHDRSRYLRLRIQQGLRQTVSHRALVGVVFCVRHITAKRQISNERTIVGHTADRRRPEDVRSAD